MEKIGVPWSVSVLLHNPKDSKKGERTGYNENQNVNSNALNTYQFHKLHP
jgi:hypothetical protein